MLNKVALLVYITLLASMFSSCEKAFLEKEREADPVNVFDEYIDIVENKFILKDILNFDLKTVTDSMRQVIIADPSEEVLGDQFSSLLHRMHDGHTRVNSDLKTYTYRYEEGYEDIIDLELLSDNYLGKESITTVTGMDFIGQSIIYFAYGLLPQDNSIGYIYIPTFFYEITEAQIDDMFAAVSSASSLIIDIRGNGGGRIEGATNFVKRLTPEAKEIGFVRIQSPTDKDEYFDSPLITEVAAEGKPTFLNKPVAVCVDRSVFSAATYLCEILRGTIDPVFVGQRTGGGTSGFIAGFLANGWAYEIATSELIRTPESGVEIRSNDGFIPNIEISDFNTANDVDKVIQAAVEAL